MKMNLLIVKLTQRKWGGRATDDDGAESIADQNNANKRKLKLVKDLLPETLRESLGHVRSQTRTFFNEHTLPWEDGGWRVIRADQLQTMRDAIGKFSAMDREVVDQILSRYAEIKEYAAKELGTLFKDEDFPTPDRLRYSYAVEFRVKALIDPKDVRVQGLSEEEVDGIRKQMTEQYEASLNTAVGDIVTQLKSIVREIKERAGNKKQDGLRYGAIQKTAVRICEALKGLNLTDDPKLNELIDGVHRKVSAIDGDEIRSSGRIRGKVFREMEGLESALSTFGE